MDNTPWSLVYLCKTTTRVDMVIRPAWANQIGIATQQDHEIGQANDGKYLKFQQVPNAELRVW